MLAGCSGPDGIPSLVPCPKFLHHRVRPRKEGDPVESLACAEGQGRSWTEEPCTAYLLNFKPQLRPSYLCGSALSALSPRRHLPKGSSLQPEHFVSGFLAVTPNHWQLLGLLYQKEG